MTGRVRVALDVHALQVEGWADRGVGRYVTGYSPALGRLGVLGAALLAPELPPASGLPNELVAAGLACWDSAATCRRLIGGGGAGDGGPLVYHLTAPFLHTEPGGAAGLGVVEHWARSGVPRVVLLHDLIPLRAPRHYLHAPGFEERYRARAEWVARSDLVVTNSEHTRQEAIALLDCDPARVVTIGVGVSPYFSPADGTDDQLWQFHFPKLEGRPHLVTVGGSDARKGSDRAIAALGLLVARGLDLSLLVIGHLTSNWRAELEYTAAACGVADRVFFGGAVDDELLRACYRRAVVSLMPSLAEGAGLPVLESAASGTPALASGSTALAEMAATPAALFDPTDVDSMAEAVAAAVDSADRRAAILAAQQAVASVSTWGAVADRAVAAMEALVGEGVGGAAGGAGGGAALAAGSGGPGRLALVGWPADRGLLADDGVLAEVVQAWAGEVDVISSEPVGLFGRRGVVDPAAFGSLVRPASYDAVVYVLTGGPGDAWVLDLAGRYAGWLWVWDRPDGDGPSECVLGALEPLVRRSCGLVLDSESARRLVRLALRPLAAEPPIVVLPPTAGERGRALASLVGVAH